MAHFAEIRSDNNKVIRVIVVSDADCAANGGEDSTECETWVANNHEDDLDLLYNEFDGTYPDTYWKRTSYNTIANTHTNGGTPFRKNYAQVGGTYDPTNDYFVALKPNDNFVLNTTTGQYDPPFTPPTDAERLYDADNTKYYSTVWDNTRVKFLGVRENGDVYIFDEVARTYTITDPLETINGGA